MGRHITLLVVALVVTGCGGSASSHALTGRLPVAAATVESRPRPAESVHEVEGSPDSPTRTGTNVETAFNDLISQRIECGRHPWSCDLSQIAVNGSPTRQRFDELFATRRSAGIVASDDGEFRYRIDDVRTRSDSEVQVTTCITDDTVLVDANGWVFDDGLFSGTVQFDMTNTAEGWRWSDDRVLSYTYGEDLCGLLD